MHQHQLPIGIDNFGTLLTRGFLFVDKSLLIKEIWDNPAQVLLLPRPRRFGKTLNLSMLHYFFAEEVYGQKTKQLFDNLLIAKAGSDYMAHQGQFPVIFISMKDIKSETLDAVMEDLFVMVHKLYRQFEYLRESKQLCQGLRQEIARILDNSFTSKEERLSALKEGLIRLCEALYTHHNKKAIILIDEYDSPIHVAYQYGFYESIISFMRHFLGAALKTNPYLDRAVLTGILRVSKESIFSDLNNIKVCSVLQKEFSRYFGFTEDEVQTLLQKTGLTHKATEIRDWYNGYTFDGALVYNPWSINNCLNAAGQCEPYWVNTSRNLLIQEQLARASGNAKEILEQLLNRQTVTIAITEHFVFPDLEKRDDMLWSLLLLSGYLTCSEYQLTETGHIGNIKIPNQEILWLYRGMISNWFNTTVSLDNYPDYLKLLLQGNVPLFGQLLSRMLVEMASYFDVGQYHPEKFYHGFILGLVVQLRHAYTVRSNRESGFGRADVLLIPNDKTQTGFVLEFKTVFDEIADLTAEAQAALDQIKAKNYVAEIKAAGVQQIIAVGLAFYGKKVAVVEGSF